MYCPKCAAPIEGIKFCRQCGANVSLVPQALTGELSSAPTSQPNQLTTQPEPKTRRRRGPKEPTPPSIESATQQFMTGLGFIFVSLACLFFAPAGRIWWFWLLIPAFVNMGMGLGQYLRLRQAQNASLPATPLPTSVPQAVAPSLPVPTTSELKLPAAAQSVAQPVSVTEHTTALLDPARQKSAEKN